MLAIGTTGSLHEIDLPPCAAITAIGEPFTYADGDALRQTLARCAAALPAGGLLLFDVIEHLEGDEMRYRNWSAEGDDWICLVEIQHDPARERLTRRIVSFRKIGNSYRRHEEIHPQQLYEGRRVARMLREIGFRVRLVRAYGDYALFDKVVGIVARKP